MAKTNLAQSAKNYTWCHGTKWSAPPAGRVTYDTWSQIRSTGYVLAKFKIHLPSHNPLSPHPPLKPPPRSIPHTHARASLTSPPPPTPCIKRHLRALAAVRSAHHGGWQRTRAHANATGTTKTATTTCTRVTHALTRLFHHLRRSVDTHCHTPARTSNDTHCETPTNCAQRCPRGARITALRPWTKTFNEHR